MSPTSNASSASTNHFYVSLVHLILVIVSLLCLLRIYSNYTHSSSQSIKRYFSSFLLSLALHSAVTSTYSYLLSFILSQSSFSSSSSSSASLFSLLSSPLSLLSSYSFISLSFFRTFGSLGFLFALLSRFTSKGEELLGGGILVGAAHILAAFLCYFAYGSIQNSGTNTLDWNQREQSSFARDSEVSHLYRRNSEDGMREAELYQLVLEVPCLFLAIWIVIVAQRQWKVVIVPILLAAATYQRYMTTSSNRSSSSNSNDNEGSNSPTVFLYLQLAALIFFYFSDMTKEVRPPSARIKEVRNGMAGAQVLSREEQARAEREKMGDAGERKQKGKSKEL